MTAPTSGVTLTPAHVLRHTPPGARAQGREAALVDIAQDLLLRELHEAGLMDELAFKGGTALRKLYAGNAGRFSLDLDFSVRHIGTRAEEVHELLAEHVTGMRLGPFAYGIEHRRGKRHLLMSSELLGAPESLSRQARRLAAAVAGAHLARLGAHARPRPVRPAAAARPTGRATGGEPRGEDLPAQPRNARPGHVRPVVGRTEPAPHQPRPRPRQTAGSPEDLGGHTRRDGRGRDGPRLRWPRCPPTSARTTPSWPISTMWSGSSLGHGRRTGRLCSDCSPPSRTAG